MTSRDRDPALQPERTALAWRRTGLNLAATTFVTARHPATSGRPTATVAVLLLGGGVALALLRLERHHRTSHARITTTAAFVAGLGLVEATWLLVP